MKNITVWKQSKFFGGANTKTPPTQLEAEEAQEILNMLPNTDGSELVLRTGFTINPFSDGDNASELARCMSFLGCSDASPTSVYRLDGILHADYVANGGNTDLKLWVSYPDDGTVNIPFYYNVKDEQVWTSGGAAQGSQGGQQPEVTPPPSGVVRWIDTAPARQCEGKVYEPASDTKFVGVRDWWTDDAGKFGDTNNSAPGYNVSNWLDDSAASVENSEATDYLTTWHNNLTGQSKIPGDTWYKSDETSFILKDGTNALLFNNPFYFKQNAIIGDARKNPTLTFPSVKFNVTLPEINTPLHVLFNYDGDYFGGMAHVYIRDASVPNSQFVKISQKSSTSTPVKFVDQSTLLEAQRWSGTGVLASYIDCSTTPSYTNVQVKVEFMPDNNVPASPYHEQLESGGILVGYYHGAA